MTDEEVKPLFTSTSVADYFDEIEKLFENEPDGRKKSEHSAWKAEINRLIEECNKLAKHKCYNQVR